MAAKDINVKITVDSTQAQKQTQNYKQRLKELKDQMTALMVETDGLSKASAEQREQFSRLEKEAGQIADAMGDAGQRIKNLSDDYQGMTAALQGVSAGVGVFTALQGSLNLFGVESENASKAIQRMTSLMGILNGLNSVAKVLNKDSALMTALNAKAHKNLNTEITKTNAAEKTGVGAMTAYTTAEGAATTGAVTLKGAVKAVGTAIKSVPVVGWILAAVSALVTLIGYISDANDEEERGNEILEERKRKQQEINDNYQRTAQSIREENAELSKLMQSLDNGEGKLYEDATKAIASYVGVSEEYIKSLSTEQSEQLKNTVLWYKETKNEVDRLKKELDEGIYQPGSTAFQEAQQKLWKGQAAIRSYEQQINSEREKGWKWVKDQTAATKALEEAERERQKRIQETTREAQALADELYSDDETRITDKYDAMLDAAVKYYGWESEEVKLVTERRQKALDDYYLSLAKKYQDEERLAEDAGIKAEEAKLKAQIASLEKNSEKYYLLKEELDRYEEEREKLELERKHEDNLISEELYQAEMDRIYEEHLAARASMEAEWENIMLENKKAYDTEERQMIEDKWNAAKTIVQTYATFVDEAMEAELSTVEGNEKEEKKIRKKYAKMKFMTQIGSIGVSTAQAIMEAWASVAEIMFPGNVIAGGILTAMLAATGIAQTVKAKSEMDKALSAEHGGKLVGKRHSNGGIPVGNTGVEVEGGEFIVNRKATQAFEPLLNVINSMPAPIPQNDLGSAGASDSNDMIRNIVKETIDGVTQIPVVVTEYSITKAQRNVRTTEQQAII